MNIATRNRCWLVSLFSVLGLIVLSGEAWTQSPEMLSWGELPPLPDAVSGQAVGAHRGALIVAGGSSFAVSPWQGGVKEWKDAIYVLEPGATAWVKAGRLPEARAHAACVSNETGMWIFGGSDGRTCRDDGLRLRWDSGAITVERLPGRLPSPCVFGGGALLGNTAYVAGGQVANDAATALNALWSLDLSRPDAAWQELTSLPGAGRILPVMVSQGDTLYVFSGCELIAGTDGKAQRRYLDDGYAYTPGGGWKSVAPVPAPVAAAAAAPYGQAHVFVISGDDGANYERTAELGDNHPGFPKRVFAYHTITDAWVEAGTLSEAYVTTQAVLWQGNIVIPGGEDRPGHRAAKVWAATPVKHTGGLGALDYAALVLYLGALVVIGFYFSRQETDTEKFFLGGRRVPWWAVGLSIFGTSLSAITYLSIPARSYATNWAWILNNMGILFLAPLIVHYYIPHFRKSPISTAYEYLEVRFNRVIRIYGSLCFMIFQIGRVGIVLLLPAIALNAATGINIYFCIFTMGALATLYTVLGGIEAVIWTDVLQSVVLVAGALLALVMIVINVDGGLGAVLVSAQAADKFHTFDWGWDCTTATVWVLLVGSFFSNAYPSTADQTMVQRYLTTSNARQAGRAVWTNALLTIPISLLFFSLGTALWAYFRQHPQHLDATLKNDAILPLFAMVRFPAGLKGILIAGVFAAAMSSLDSSINSVASVLLNDYYRRWRPQLVEKRALRAAQIITLTLGVFGTAAAMYAAQINATSLWDPFLALLNFVGGGLAGIFALGVFTKRANGFGAIIGAVGSAVAVLLARQTALHFFLHGMVGFLTAFALGYLASLMIPAHRIGSVGRRS